MKKLLQKLLTLPLSKIALYLTRYVRTKKNHENYTPHNKSFDQLLLRLKNEKNWRSIEGLVKQTGISIILVELFVDCHEHLLEFSKDGNLFRLK